MNKLKIFMLSVFLGVMIVVLTSCDDDGSGGGIGATDAPLPQTGQTTCYNQAGTMINCADTGQDGDIQAGVVPPVPRFADNGEGQITDNLTGLVWLRNADCFGKRRWVIALGLANSLESGQCGLTDGSIPGQWRLPNRNELRSLLDAQNFNPALPSGHPFDNVRNDGYWTSTTYTFRSSVAWDVELGSSRSVGQSKGQTNFVIMVRDPIIPIEAPATVPVTGQVLCWNAPGTVINCAGTGQDGDIQAGVQLPVFRFTDNNDGTVTDKLTELVWLKNSNCFGDRAWAQALAGANRLEDGLCGLSDGSVPGDWRLPNRNELVSLFNLQNSNPATDLNAPLSTGNVLYWTSTSYPANAARAWEIPVIDGAIGHFAKTNSRLVTAVRDQF